jgi:hypothetical protein
MLASSLPIGASNTTTDHSQNDHNEPNRTGIDRAFDVIRNHTVHTKGYVLTALKLIEEFGSGEDKARLNELLQSKTESLAIGTADTPRKPIQKKK